MYAIKNTKNNKWVYGIDYRYPISRPRLSHEKARLFEDKEWADIYFKTEIKKPKHYEIVEVKLMEVTKEETNL